MYGGGGDVPPGLLLPLGGELVVVKEAAEKEKEREVVEREEKEEEEGEEQGGKKEGKKEGKKGDTKKDDSDEESSMLSTMTPVWVRCFDPCFKRFGWYTTLFNNSNAVHPTPDFDFFKPKGDWMQKYRAVSPWLYSVDKRGKPIDPSTLASLAPTHPIWPVSERGAMVSLMVSLMASLMVSLMVSSMVSSIVSLMVSLIVLSHPWRSIDG